MVLTRPGAPAAPAAPATAVARQRHAYDTYGLRVESEVVLPLPEADAADGVRPDWTVRLAPTGVRGEWVPEPDGELVFEERCPCPSHGGRPFVRVHRGPGGDWIWNDHAGLCHVLPDGRLVDVYPQPDADPGALALQILGPVSGRALHRLGLPQLHGAAVVAGGTAFAFIGPAGHGKTSAAAAFLRRGAALLSDDILPLRSTARGVEAMPGAPLMKLWEESAGGALGITGDLPALAAHLTKKRLTLGGPQGAYPLATAPVRLRAIYVPQRYDAGDLSEGDLAGAITVEPLAGHAALTTLLSQTYRAELLTAAEQARLLPLYARLNAQSPVKLLRYPNGFRYQDAVCARVLADATGTSGATGAGAGGAA